MSRASSRFRSADARPLCRAPPQQVSPGSPPSSRTRAVGQPHPLMDATSSSACHRIPAAPVSPCSRRSRDSSPRSRDVCPREEDALAWLGAEEAPRCSTSLCVGNKEDLLSHCCLLRLHCSRELLLSLLTHHTNVCKDLAGARSACPWRVSSMKILNLFKGL